MSSSKAQFIKDLKEGDLVGSDFRINEVQDALTKSNRPYKRFKLSDKTGSIPAIFWDSSDCTHPFKSGDICFVGGKVGAYNGQPQFTVDRVMPRVSTGDQDFDLCSKYDIERMWDRLMGFVTGLEDTWIRMVAEDIFLHQGYQDRFKQSPAATGMHHAFKGGLLEHTSQMAVCADALLKLPFFEPLNKDLCMFGILFHDAMKVCEYDSGNGFKKTLQGTLVPHIPMMGALVFQTCNVQGVPEIIRDHLMHVVLAHHNLIEWGSPVVPVVPEAAFVHYVDNLHGTVFGYLQKIEANPGKELVEHWGNNGKFNLVGESFTSILNRVKEHIAPEESLLPHEEAAEPSGVAEAGEV